MKVRFKIYFLFLLIIQENPAFSQSVSTLMGARGAGLGYATATLSDEWSMLNNIGGLSKADHPCVSFAFEARPSLPGADRMAATFSAPLKTGVAGFSLFRFGDALYSEQIIAAGYSNQMGLASLGIKVNYIQYRAEGFGTRNAVSITFGGIVPITPQLTVGAYITNLNQPRLSSAYPERLPTKLTAGLSYKPDSKIILVTEIEKDLAFKPTLKAAAEYLIHTQLNFRTGFNLYPTGAFFGLGLSLKNLKIDYALQHSEPLRLAHQASVICRLQKKKKIQTKISP